MVLFAMLVFGLLAMAALTIDVGLANLTQAQMQTAVDTAALEGLKLRDFHEYRAVSNEYRRPRVSNLVRMVFDDDLQPTQGIPATLEDILTGNPGVPADNVDSGSFSVGPIIGLRDGLGASNASALIDVPAAGQYDPAERHLDDPVLQINLRNLRNGDMLSGTFESDAFHHEIDSYEREDFEPAPNAAVGRLSLGFLVRMRRTNVTGGPDQVSGVSSSGPAVPFLFGMGAAIESEAGSTYEPRFDGLSVRATAIAVARPALTVGPPPLNPNGTPVRDRRGDPIRGVGPFAFNKEFWRDVVPPSGLGSIRIRVRPVDGSVIDCVGTVVGQCIIGCNSVGQSVESNATLYDPAPFASGIAPRVYVPIYAEIVNPSGVRVNRIIGYGCGELSLEPLNSYPPGCPDDGFIPLSLYKLTGFNGADSPTCNAIVAPDNASAHLSRDLAPTDLSIVEWDRVFAELVSLYYKPVNGVSRFSYDCDDIHSGNVFAPALAR